MSSPKSQSARRKVVNADEAYLSMCTGALAISHRSVRCRACEGAGFRGLSPEDMKARAAAIAAENDPRARGQLRKDLSTDTTCRVCLGIGYTTQRRADRASAMDSMFTTVRCGRCRGAGETMPPTDTSAEREDVCLACGGDAYIVPVTVKDTGSTKNGRAPARENADRGDYPPSHTVNAPILEASPEEHLGDQNRAELQRALAADPQVAAGLASYMGPEGDRWVNHGWGRAFAVWRHTASGKQLAQHLAETTARGAGHLQDATTLIKTAREAFDRGQLPGTRDGSLIRVLLGRAHAEARDLMQRLERALDGVQAA